MSHITANFELPLLGGKWSFNPYQNGNQRVYKREKRVATGASGISANDALGYCGGRERPLSSTRPRGAG